MSIRAWGSFKLESGVSIIEIKAFSFQVIKIAAEHLRGIKLGWNVSLDLRKEFEGRLEVVPFELTDNPLTNVAEILFGGDGVRLFEKNQRVDLGETLDARMKNVQNFILDVFKIKIIEEMVLHINSGFGEEQIADIKAKDFKNAVLGKYTHGKTWEPTVKFIISK